MLFLSFPGSIPEKPETACREGRSKGVKLYRDWEIRKEANFVFFPIDGFQKEVESFALNDV